MVKGGYALFLVTSRGASISGFGNDDLGMQVPCEFNLGKILSMCEEMEVVNFSSVLLKSVHDCNAASCEALPFVTDLLVPCS